MHKIVLALLVIFVFSLDLIAQNLSDIQNLKVDNLSNSQIEELIRRYESQGLSTEQMLSYATERGMQIEEVNKLRTRIASIGNSTNAGKLDPQSPSRKIQINKLGDKDAEIKMQDKSELFSPFQDKIFGFRLFYNNHLSFTPELNIPTPPTYVLGRGDELLIDIYGASQQTYQLTINPEGKVVLPVVGPLEVGGLTVAAATSRIKNALRTIYSGLFSSPPNTFMELRLGNIKTVTVAMVGEVNQPGNIALPSFASPIHALFAAGGITEKGSFRHVQLYRNNQLLLEIDIYDFLIKGVFTSSTILQDNDVIIVPPVRSRVEIDGPVRRNGLFEMKVGETLDHLIHFAGGFTSLAFQERITVNRKTGTEYRVEDVSNQQFTTFLPQEGDYFRVGEISQRYENRIQISGAINRPGVFALKEGMKVSDLIDQAGGLRKDAFLKRATLFRTKEDFSLEILSVDVQEILQGADDLLLIKEDVLNIPSIYELREEYYLKISGEINHPGAYPFGENISVEDLVIQAGGLKESATTSRVEIVRRVKEDWSGKLAEIIVVNLNSNLEKNSNSSSLVLYPFDHVIIRKSPGFQREKLVKVEGEAFFPGEFAISRANERISDLIKRAGGLSPYAYPKGATLIRRNEFYKEPIEEEVLIETLTNVLSNVKRDSVNWSDSDKVLTHSILQRINNYTKRTPPDKGLMSSEDFKQETITNLGERASPLEQYEIKDTELIGINLETILKQPNGPDDLVLNEGDVISIPRVLQTVRMRGEVLYPTSTRYKPYFGFKNYISQAGGFTEKSRRGRSFVIYANGDVKKTKKFLFVNVFPKVEPGAELIVPQKPERIPLTTQGWIGLGTSLATLAIIINNLIN
jgi:protein involved in polysaccharide export with SLBB domain